ncbi:5'-deoxynucleotidase [Escherichia coli]
MSFIKTFSGKHFYYDRINKDDIVINDIAVSFSNICRFAGHLSHFYSVAQHAVLCSQLVPQEFAFEALMHDATEAYCQDIPAPLKRLLPDYKRMEEKIDAVIREKYELPPVMSTPVKYADLIMLATERRDLGLDDGSLWPVLEGIPATEMFKVIPLAPGHAYGMFMERFNELSELRKCA